jgi:predicted AlkP superfamily pyrophosphatase or phosphodiesterase
MAECFFVGYMIGKDPRVDLVPDVKFPKKKLLLISIDGFRFDYIMRGKTPNLAQLGSA